MPLPDTALAVPWRSACRAVNGSVPSSNCLLERQAGPAHSGPRVPGRRQGGCPCGRKAHSSHQGSSPAHTATAPAAGAAARPCSLQGLRPLPCAALGAVLLDSWEGQVSFELPRTRPRRCSRLPSSSASTSSSAANWLSKSSSTPYSSARSPPWLRAVPPDPAPNLRAPRTAPRPQRTGATNQRPACPAALSIGQEEGRGVEKLGCVRTLGGAEP